MSRFVRYALAFSLLAWASRAASADALAAEEPRASAVRLDGSEVRGRLVGFDGSTIGIVDEREPRIRSDLPLIEVLSLELEVRAPPSAVAQPVLEFANGDRMHAEIGETTDDELAVRWHGQSVTVPLGVLRGVLFRPLDPSDGSTELLHRAGGPSDIVLLSNGDRLVGQFIKLGPNDLKIDVEGREVLAPRDRVQAILFSPELTNAAAIAGLRQLVHDESGWMTVEGLTREQSGAWSGTTAFGERVSWPTGGVRRVQVFSQRVVPLSSLEPQVEFTPYLERAWPVREARTVTGEPLTIGETTYATGIGVHSRCRLKYELGGQFEAFHVVAGMAESAGELGSAEFAVELDGREVVRTGPVRRSSEPLRITNLDVRSVGTMTLTVDFGRNGDVLDRANWCDAILVRKPATSE